MRHALRILALHLLNVLAVGAFASSAGARTHRCASHSFESLAFRYCLDFDDRKLNPDLVYVLHGSNGTEKDWVEAPDNRDIQAVWDRHGTASPTKITVSFGNEWMFTDVPGSQNKPYQRIFAEKVIPFIEAKIEGPIGRRFLKGVSMGGWNGSQLLFKYPNLFERVALICPVISSLGPFSTQKQISAFYDKHSEFINRDWVEDLLSEERGYFPTPREWRQHDPLSLIESGPLALSRLYLSCGSRDEYGFYNGTKLFAQKARAQGRDVIWKPTTGGHCVIDAESVAKFLTD